MAVKIDPRVTPGRLVPRLERLFELSATKILNIERSWKNRDGAPVFTVAGKYTTRGWTEWTQGFQFGSALLQYDATGDKLFLDLGRQGTIERMATHVSHIGVHDHGFNNVSTYGNLLRLSREDRIPDPGADKNFCELALKVSGAVQAARWTRIADGSGFIHSFNGPHSLFIDTMRSLRSLAIAHQLGHVLMGERDERISLLRCLAEHAINTARYNVYYGIGRDAFDVRGRVAHESIFNVTDGSYRCPSSQQGWSAFSTWTRGLAWAILGFAEQLEFLGVIGQDEFPKIEVALVHHSRVAQAGRRSPDGTRIRGSRAIFEAIMVDAATAAAEYYLEIACADGVPVWDDRAPGLCELGDYRNRPADPFNEWEPVDSSAAVIAAQGLIRLGNYFNARRRYQAGVRFRQAGLTIADAVFDEPYLSTKPRHQGLILHSVYHRPNGWDFVPPGHKVPCGESSMWGDYHARELALLLLREAKRGPYPTFFDPKQSPASVDS